MRKIDSFLVLTLIIGSAPIALGGLPAAEDRPNLRERFIKEAPLAWEEYLKFTKRLNGSISTENTQLTPTEATWWKSRIEVKQRIGCVLVRENQYVDNFRPDRLDKLSSANPRYGFVLQRGDSERPWVLVELDEAKGGGPSPALKAATWSWPWDYLASPVALTCLPFDFEAAGHNPATMAGRVESIVQDGRDLIKVEIEFRPPSDDLSTPSLEGWAVFDPARSWVMLKRHLLARHPNPKSNYHQRGVLSEVDIDYSTAESAFPIPRRVTHKKTIYDKNLSAVDHAELDLAEVVPPEGDFTLSSYGLPEPRRRHPALWFLYAIAAGLACLAISSWLRRKSRVTRPARGGPSPIR